MAQAADRNDADLVADVRAGNAASFGLLFDRWFGPVLAAAEDMLGDQTEAARVATDTFQSVWLHLDELADPDGFGAWVLLTSRTFARQRRDGRDPSADGHAGPVFANSDELRRAVAKVLVRRQVPALGQPVPAAAAGPARDHEGDPDTVVPVDAGQPPELAVAGTATDRLHRYHWAPAEPASGMAERILSFRPSVGTVVAVAIMLLGSVIWLISRDDSSEIDGSRPAPLFSPAGPTTIDGAAARSGNGAAAPGGVGVAPGSLPPDPASPAPTAIPDEEAAPAGGRTVKVATVVPRSVATTPARRGTTVSAPGRPTPVATVSTVPTTSGTPRTEDQPSTTATTAAPSSVTSTVSTARTTTEPTTVTTGRTTTTAEPTTATSRVVTTTTTAQSTTVTTRGIVTTTTREGTTTSTSARVTTPTTRATTVTTDAPTTTARPPSTSALAPATRVTASSTTAAPATTVDPLV